MTRVASASASLRRRPVGGVDIDHPRVAVEPVERRRELGGVGGDPVGLLGGDGVLDDFGEAGDGPGQRRLGCAIEPTGHA